MKETVFFLEKIETREAVERMEEKAEAEKELKANDAALPYHLRLAFLIIKFGTNSLVRSSVRSLGQSES